MEHTRYSVSQATALVGVQASVLRYWEEELKLRIMRNDQGHRCYTGYDIQLFLNIKELKKRGLQLKAIKELIPKMSRQEPGSGTSKIRLLEDAECTSQEVTDGEERGAEKDSGELKEQGTVQLQRSDTPPNILANEEKILEFQMILERLIAKGLKEKNKEEVRYRSIDEAIRYHQQIRREAAAAREGKRRKIRSMRGSGSK